MFWLESGPLTSTTTNVVYLCRPLIRNIKIVAGKSSGPGLAYHTYLTVSADRPHQETRERVPETRVYPHPYTARFDIGQPDPGGGRRVGRGQHLFVQSPIHSARGGRSLAGERQRVQGNMGGMYSSSAGWIACSQNETKLGRRRNEHIRLRTSVGDAAEIVWTLPSNTWEG